MMQSDEYLVIYFCFYCSVFFEPSHSVGGSALGWWELLLNDAKHLLFLTRQPIVVFGDGRMDGRSSTKVGQLWFPSPTYPSPFLRGLITWLFLFLNHLQGDYHEWMGGGINNLRLWIREWSFNWHSTYYGWTSWWCPKRMLNVCPPCCDAGKGFIKRTKQTKINKKKEDQN